MCPIRRAPRGMCGPLFVDDDTCSSPNYIIAIAWNPECATIWGYKRIESDRTTVLELLVLDVEQAWANYGQIRPAGTYTNLIFHHELSGRPFSLLKVTVAVIFKKISLDDAKLE